LTRRASGSPGCLGGGKRLTEVLRGMPDCPFLVGHRQRPRGAQWYSALLKGLTFTGGRRSVLSLLPLARAIRSPALRPCRRTRWMVAVCEMLSRKGVDIPRLRGAYRDQA